MLYKMLYKIVMTEPYRAALIQAKKDLEEARKRYSDALEEQKRAEEDIAKFRHAVAGLSKICDEPFNDEDDFGLTNKIRLVLKSKKHPLTALHVRTELQLHGFDVSSESSLPSIHTILKRLVSQGELDDSTTIEGKTAYSWIGKSARVESRKQDEKNPATSIS